MATFEERLRTLGLTLPEPARPVASYVAYVQSGSLVFISGQLPMQDGKPAYTGIPGSAAEGQAAARLCALNLLAQLRAACGGSLDRVVRCVRLGGFIQSKDGDGGQPAIMNGASDLMLEVFGEAGKHARAAVGTNALPMNASVEVEGTFEIIT